MIWSCFPQPKLSSHSAFQTLSVGILCQRPAHVELQQLGHRPWRLAHASMCCSFIPDSPTRLPYSQRPNPLSRQWYGNETCHLSRGESQRWKDLRYQTSQGRAGWQDHCVDDSWFRQEGVGRGTRGSGCGARSPCCDAGRSSLEPRYVRGNSNPTIKGYTLPIVAKGVCEARHILRKFILTSPGPSPAAESKLARHWLRADGPVSTENGNMQNVLGLVALSDIFLLDSAPRIYGLGSTSRRRNLRVSVWRGISRP